VVLEPGEGVRGVTRPPLSGTLAEWRAAPLGERLWAVTFSELPADTNPPVGAPVDGRLWYGTYENGRWASLARIPLPGGWKLLPASASSLARSGDTLALAMSMDSAAHARRLVLFERRGSRCSYRMLRFRASYVDLAHVEGMGLVTAFVRAGSSAGSSAGAGGTFGGGSLFLHPLRSSSSEPRRVDTGSTDAVHEPSLAGGPGAAVLSWWTIVRDSLGTRFQANAIVDPLASAKGSVLTLDPDINSLVQVPTPAGAHLWLTDHVIAGTSRELRLLAASAGGTHVLWRAPNPFDGRFRAVALSNSRLLLVGPSFDRSRGVLASLVLHLQLRCDPGSW
jgi:hypothetical protein